MSEKEIKEKIIEENKRFTINLPRRYGKITMGLQQFYADCKNGKKTILKMPEGDVYSPEALKGFLSQEKQKRGEEKIFIPIRRL